MTEKLVSVNITTHNRAQLLPRCIDSILSQSYKNIEIIIVDDCSSDNTTEIVKEYQRKDERIKYLRHETNKRNAHARNTGLKNCRGYYVAFMDDDDEWIDSDKLKKQVEIFEISDDKKLGVVCSGIKRVYSDSKENIEKAIEPKNIKETVLSGGLIHNSTAMTKRDIIVEVGVFDEKIKRGVDSEFFRRLIVMYDKNIYFMDDITCKYYENSPNRMTVKSIRGLSNDIEAYLYILEKYKEYFKQYSHIKLKRKIQTSKRLIKMFLTTGRVCCIRKFLKFLMM